MLIIAAVIWLLVLVMLVHVLRRRPEVRGELIDVFLRNGRIFIVVVPMAMIAAGFLVPLVPPEMIAIWLSDGAGLEGILIATMVGWLLAVPPYIMLAIVAVLIDAGAGAASMVALITAWSVFGFHRTLPIELPIMGRYFVTLRLLVTFLMPPLAGLATALTVLWF